MDGIMAAVASPQWNGPETGSEWSNEDSLKGLYTCLACQIGFHTVDLQRQHYRTDWYYSKL